MKWVTRERPKIDRIACPWLIARLIDRERKFLYVPAPDVLKVVEETGAIPFDIPGVVMSHDGDLCSFDMYMRGNEVEYREKGHVIAAGFIWNHASGMN